MASWVEAEKSEGSESPKMNEGYHRAKVEKVVRHKGKGENVEELRTDKGPYMILVFANPDGEEATTSLWLTEKAKWKFAKVLSRLGVDLQKMDEAGITIEHFKDEEYANKSLAGRTCIIKAEADGKYVNAEPHHEHELPIEVLKRLNAQHAEPEVAAAAAGQQTDPGKLDPDDIPF